MKRINAVVATAAAILTSATFASAGYTYRYTVPYAAGGNAEMSGAETVVSAVNKSDAVNNILVVFRDTAGAAVCAAVAPKMAKKASAILATSYYEDVPPFGVTAYAFAVAEGSKTIPPQTTAEPCPSFQGRAEIYSTSESMKVPAAFLSASPGGELTDISVQK